MSNLLLGYFRILYEKKELHLILQELTKTYIQGQFIANAESENIYVNALQSLERSQLLDDYFTFAFSSMNLTENLEIDFPISIVKLR